MSDPRKRKACKSVDLRGRLWEESICGSGQSHSRLKPLRRSSAVLSLLHLQRRRHQSPREHHRLVTRTVPHDYADKSIPKWDIFHYLDRLALFDSAAILSPPVRIRLAGPHGYLVAIDFHSYLSQPTSLGFVRAIAEHILPA